MLCLDRPENMVFQVRTSKEPEFINIYFITEAATRILFQTATWAKKVQVGDWPRFRPIKGRHQDPLPDGRQGQEGSGMLLVHADSDQSEAATRILFQSAAWAKKVKVCDWLIF